MPFLKACLDSILHQSITNWELIAVDDHSDDDSFTCLDKYAARDSRVKVYKSDGTGIIPALQKAYSLSQGSFITRMDADDRMRPEKLQLLHAKLLTTHLPGVAVGQVSYFSEEGLKEGYRKYAHWLNENVVRENPFVDVYKECVIPSIAWMMRREDLDGIGAFDGSRYPEDYDFTFRVYLHKLPILAVPEVIHEWRDHAGRTSRNDPIYLDNRFLSLKIHYFLKVDYHSEGPLIVWGAGKKGKLIVQELLKARIPLQWVSDNENKIGHQVYGVPIQHSDAIIDHPSGQLIIAIASPQDQVLIRKKINSFPTEVKTYWFC